MQANELLAAWVAEKAENGIEQHSAEWHAARVYTVGGSSMSVIEGNNPYSSLRKFLAERLGLTAFRSGHPMQWGNLFEPVIQAYVELDLETNIIGEDLYVLGPPGSSYSPDGLAVVDLSRVKFVQSGFGDDMPVQPRGIKTVLMEFKCPFSRIPDGAVPVYYVPQVKMGLELLNFPECGIFAETVIRRCSWDDLEYTPAHDMTLVDGHIGSLPLAYSFIGLSVVFPAPQSVSGFLTAFKEYYGEIGTPENEFQCNDAGIMPPNMFKEMLGYINEGSIIASHCKLIRGPGREVEVTAELNNFISKHSKDLHLLAVIPYKILRVDYHHLERQRGYFDKHYPTILKIHEFLKSQIGRTIEEKELALDKFCAEMQPDKKPPRRAVKIVGFSD